jgi:putative ABC transport system permease protein
MWAAIRYRRTQAVVLVLLSALTATCAVFAPLYQRALEQSLLRTSISAASVADTALVVRSGRGPANPTFLSSALSGNVPGSVRVLYGTPVGQMSDSIDIVPRDGLKPSPGDLVARDKVCDHLRITTGACPRTAGEILVSAKDLAAWKWPLGKKLTTSVPSVSQTDRPTAVLTVVGAYEVLPDAAYWQRTQLDGKSGTLITIGLEQVPAIDDFVTVEDTFTRDWSVAQATLTFPLRRDLFTLGNLQPISDVLASRGGSRAAGEGVDGALVETQLPTIIDGIRVGQHQLRVIVPLLMAQLGLLAAAILLLVAQAAVEQRRPEVALARLRGRSREGAGRIVMGELAATVAIGLPIGFVLALLLTTLVRWFLLPDGVPFEVPWYSVVALAASAVVCAIAIWLAARPVQRLTVSALLRRVSRERARAFGIVDILAVALATFGLIGLATGSLEGPLALITPTLVALAAGLVASRLAIPVAGASGRANLRRGRIGPALTAFGLERRPTLRKVVTVVSVAVALTVFAANALVVGNRNWTARAEVQTGAPAVIDTDSHNPASLLASVRGIDPTGTVASPVAIVRRTDAKATATMAVVTKDFEETSFAPPGEPYRLGALAPPDIAPVQLKGTKVTGRLAWDLSIPDGDVTPRPSDQSGAPTDPTIGPGSEEPSELRILVTTPQGQRLTRLIAQIPLRGKGSAELDGLLLCPDGCRLDGLEFRKTDQQATQVSGTLRITGFGIDGKSLDIAAPNQWNPFVAPPTSTGDALEQLPAGNDTLALQLTSTGFALELSHADVPAVVPGLLAGALPPGGTAQGFDAVGLNGTPISVAVQQAVDTLPVLGGQGVLVDYETLARLGGRLPDAGTLSVWVADPAKADAVATSLQAQGVGVLARHSTAAAKDRLDESASAWGLRLAAFTGGMSVLLAALVVLVMTVTGWRVVARDLAALHMSGVPLKELRRSLVREQVVLVGVGTVVGVLCGAVSSFVAMPLVPLFDSAVDPVPALELAPAAVAIVGSALGAGLVLVAVGWLAAVGAGRRITLRRIRESL